MATTLELTAAKIQKPTLIHSFIEHSCMECSARLILLALGKILDYGETTCK